MQQCEICNMPPVGGNNYAVFFRVDKRDVKCVLSDFYAGVDAVEGVKSVITEQ